MTSQELRKKFLEFFKAKGHEIIPSASLIPAEIDPTALFTSAGMHPLVPYLLGKKHPQGKRLADVQKCVRTQDLEEVGDAWHLTFFEMLGNWSLGDYFKEEAIRMAWEFLTDKKWLGIDPERLSVSVFVGDSDAPRDKEAAYIWQKVGVPQERIYYYPKEENWWGPVGGTGPCGPDTEIFFDTLKSPWRKPHKCEPRCECGRYAEIWNLVFMEYNKKVKSKKSKVKSYEYEPLKQKNVDTGMGLERTIAILNGKDNVYETDLFEPIMEKVKSQISKVKSKSQKSKVDETRALRIPADHLRAATFILADGIIPSNKDQGYVLRRLVRRAVMYAKQISIADNFTTQLADVVIDIYKDIYPELKRNENFIKEELLKEEEKFERALGRGLDVFNKWVQIKIFWEDKESKDTGKIIPGKYVFDLYQNYGFPLELTREIAKEKGLAIDEKGFQKLFKKHQKISRKGAAQRFKGGLADTSKQTIKYHTATHLLHSALRQVLGKHVEQRGSNITEERLRFDFSHPDKLTPEQIQEVEEIVNEKIKENLPVKCEEMSVKQARKQGAIGLFEQKYGDKVKVYSIGNFSCEICGGPHVKNTSGLGEFKIIKEESSSQGVRRIKAKLT